MTKLINQVLPLLPGALVAGLLLTLVALRADAVDQKIGVYIACPGCFDSVVFQNDLALSGLVFGILLLAGFVRPDWLARSMQAIAGIVILVYAADLVLFHLFHARLFMSDAALFISERAAIWDQFASGMGGWLNASLILLAAAGLMIGLVALRPARQRSSRGLLTGLFGISLLAALPLERQPYVNSWAVENVFAANLATTASRTYSEEYLARMPLHEMPARQSGSAHAGGPGNGRNVIVVLLESWSSWHSDLFRGFENWTPRLDAAAARGLRFTNFHAIGFSTAQGLMGILAGAPLSAPFMHWYESTPFHSMWGMRHTLPATFRARGYSTAFLTTGPLELYVKGEWLKDIGFQYVEGQEHEFYAGQPAFAFGAPPDRALYQRAEQWRRKASGPYLLVLETVTTHQPYTDPDTGERSLERAMKYADREFGAYLESLDQTGFFEEGLLVVVSDHRSMTPIPDREFRRFGYQAFSQVPMFMLGQEFGPEQVDDSPYSQSDLVPSFEWWLSGQGPTAANDAVLFPMEDHHGTMAANEPGKCAFHGRGNQPGLVDVHCNHGSGLVRLDGDQTRFISSEALDEQHQEAILLEIARVRLQGLKRHQIQPGPRQ
jgi:lipoteichoic acid synthase